MLSIQAQIGLILDLDKRGMSKEDILGVLQQLQMGDSAVVIKVREVGPIPGDHYKNANERVIAVVASLYEQLGEPVGVSRREIHAAFREAPNSGGRACKLAPVTIDIALGQMVRAGRLTRSGRGYYKTTGR